MQATPTNSSSVAVVRVNSVALVLVIGLIIISAFIPGSLGQVV